MHSQEMWLGGLVVTCGLFLAGLAYYRRQTRIERVVTEYLSKFRSGNYTNGLDTLLKCGANELENRFELYEVCRKILKREKKAQDPLGVSDLPRRDVFAFIKWCHKNNEDISSGSDTMVLIAQFRGDLPKEKL